MTKAALYPTVKHLRDAIIYFMKETDRLNVAEEDHDLLYGIAKESAKAIISLVKEKNEDGLIMTADALASEWRKRTKHDYGNHRPGVRIDFRSFADDGIVVVMFDLDTEIEGTASV